MFIINIFAIPVVTTMLIVRAMIVIVTKNVRHGIHYIHVTRLLIIILWGHIKFDNWSSEFCKEGVNKISITVYIILLFRYLA